MTLMKSYKHARSEKLKPNNRQTGKDGRQEAEAEKRSHQEARRDDHVDEKRNQTGNRSARTTRDATDENKCRRDER